MARYAYITILQAVKTGQPQDSRALLFKKRAKVLLFFQKIVFFKKKIYSSDDLSSKPALDMLEIESRRRLVVIRVDDVHGFVVGVNDVEDVEVEVGDETVLE